MKTSVILTIHDREAAVLMAMLRSLQRSIRTEDDAEVVIANDRSEKNLDWMVEALRMSGLDYTWVDVADYPAFRIPGTGHNGPSRAFNEALAVATGERIIAMSSDVIVTPRAWRAALAVDPKEGMWSPRVWDLEGVPFMEYCGPTRVFPMPWFLSMDGKTLRDVGGWDEKYLEGISYDDNDIAGRVCLAQGRFFLDYETQVYHQSHPLFIDSRVPEMKEALDRNREWTMKKWTGVPFEGMSTPFDVLRRPHKSGRISFEVKAPEGRLESVIAQTTGLFAKAA